MENPATDLSFTMQTNGVGTNQKVSKEIIASKFSWILR